MKPNGYDELVARYGKPWRDELSRQIFEDRWMTLWGWRGFANRTGVFWPADLSFGAIWCNKDILPLLDGGFKALIQQNLIHEIKTFDGCWDVRMKRGQPTKPSVHSWGIAIDLNAAEMPFGSTNCIWSDNFLQVMDASGWTLGHEFTVPDNMHFQYADNY